MPTAGGIRYLVEAQTKGLNQAASQAEKLVSSLDRTAKAVNRLALQMEKSTSRSGVAMRQAAKSQQTAAKQSEAAEIKKITALEKSRRAFEKQSADLEKAFGKDKRAINSLTQSFQALEKRAKSGVGLKEFTRQNERFATVLDRSKRKLQEQVAVQRQAQAENTKSSQRVQQAATAQGKLRANVVRTISEMKRLGGSRQEIVALAKTYGEYSRAVKRGETSTAQFTNVQNRLKKRLSETNRSLSEIKSSGKKGLQLAVQDLTKSVQLALGPLSGVASRITALSALFTAQNAAIASLIGGFTGFLVLLARAVVVGTQAEKQLRKIEGVLLGMGASIEEAADKTARLNNLARELGRITLSSANEMRGAIALVSTFGNIGEENFKRTLLAAQGLTAVMGGNVQTNIRRLGRLLEAPTENLSSLRRAGIQFSQTEKDLIETFESLGEVSKAQEIIFKRLNGAVQASQQETKGLAGSMDTLVENFNLFLERAVGVEAAVSGNTSGLGELANVADQVAGRFERLSNTAQIVDRVNTSLTNSAIILGNALTALAENVDLVVLALVGFVGGTVGRGLIALGRSAVSVFGSLVGIYKKVTGAVTVLNTTYGALFATLARGLPVVGLIVGGLVALGLRSKDSVKSNEELAKSFDKVSTAGKRFGKNLADLNKNQLEELIKNTKTTIDVLGSRLVRRLNSLSIDAEKRIGATALQRINAVAQDLPRKILLDVGDPEADIKSVISRLEEARKAANESVKTAADLQNRGAQRSTIRRVLEIDALIEQLEELGAQKNNLDNLSASMDVLIEKMKRAEQLKLSNLADTVSELAKEYGIAGENVVEYARRLELANKLQENTDALVADFGRRVTELEGAGLTVPVGAVENFRNTLGKVIQALLLGPSAYEKHQKAIDDARKSYEKAADSVSELFKENQNLLGQKKALETDGLGAFELVKQSQEVEDAVSGVRKELKELSEGQLAKLAERFGITSVSVEGFVTELEKLVRTGLTTEEAIRKMADASKDLESKLPGIITEFKQLQEQRDALSSGGKSALGAIIKQQEIDEAGQKLRKLAENVVKPQEALAELKKEFPDLLAGVNKLPEALEKLGRAGERMSQNMEESFGKLTDFAEEFGSTLGDAIGALATGSLRAKDFLKELSEQVVDLVAQLVLVEPIANNIASAIKQIGKAGGANAGTSGLGIFEAIIQGLAGGLGGSAANAGKAKTGFSDGPNLDALGNAYNRNAKVIKMARGGILDRATSFATANGPTIAGEAGPEAVLPLRRGRGGRLGVSTEGGGANVSIQVINASGEPVRIQRRRQPDGTELRQIIIGTVREDIARNGPLFQDLIQSTNLIRRGGSSAK